MSSFEERNAYFDRLFASENLFWLGQNTNHLPMHPAMRRRSIDSINSRSFTLTRRRAASSVYCTASSRTSVCHKRRRLPS